MIKPEQIPDEVVEAAAIADYEAWRDWADLRADTLDWELIEEEVQEEHRISARASIAAALQAWPGMMPVSEVFTAGGDFYRPHLILPLPQEARDE